MKHMVMALIVSLSILGSCDRERPNKEKEEAPVQRTSTNKEYPWLVKVYYHYDLDPVIYRCRLYKQDQGTLILDMGDRIVCFQNVFAYSIKLEYDKDFKTEASSTEGIQ